MFMVGGEYQEGRQGASEVSPRRGAAGAARSARGAARHRPRLSLLASFAITTPLFLAHSSARRNRRHRSAVIRFASALTPCREKYEHRFDTSRSNKRSACGLKRGSTACGKSITVTAPSQHSTLYAERS